MAAIDTSTIKNLHLPAGGYVLVLPGWYPTWLDAYTGDFNQRQVWAAGLKIPQVVLYIGKAPIGSLPAVEVRSRQVTETVVEIIVLYPEHHFFDSVRSNTTFFQLLKQFSKIIVERWGKPDLLHAYIVIRGGLAAWHLSRNWKIPFVLSEHWTIYYPEDPGYLKKRNPVFRHLVKVVLAKVSAFMPVANQLRLQAEKFLKPLPSFVVPNVVDTEIFCLDNVRKSNPTFRFVHISTMTYQKNPEGLLRAFAKYNRQNTNCCLWLTGPYPQEVFDYAHQLQLGKAVHFTGSVTYHEVAGILRESDALVLFSRYENLPCVVLEALCCGVPVISTNVGGISEVVDKSNGLLIPAGDEEELCSSFHQMVAGYLNYDRFSIAAEAKQKYSYDAVGNQIMQAYKSVIE